MNGIFHRFAARNSLPRCGAVGKGQRCAFHIDHASLGRLSTTGMVNTTGLLRLYDRVMGPAPRRVVTILREPVQTFVSRCGNPPPVQRVCTHANRAGRVWHGRQKNGPRTMETSHAFASCV